VSERRDEMDKQVKHLRVSHGDQKLLDLRGRNVTPKSIDRALRLFLDLVEHEQPTPAPLAPEREEV
jgi:hypothetical protein